MVEHVFPLTEFVGLLIMIEYDDNVRWWLIMMIMTSFYKIQIPDFMFTSMVIYLWGYFVFELMPSNRKLKTFGAKML